MIPAIEVARYFLSFTDEDAGELISNLKLQKLLYYAQAWYLALYDNELFNEEIEAWVHGPVVYSVYNRFKDYKWNNITEQPANPNLSVGIRKHLVEIMRVFGGFSARQLEQMTHREDPWKKARKNLPLDEPSRNIIDTKNMKEYYKQFASN